MVTMKRIGFIALGISFFLWANTVTAQAQYSKNSYSSFRDRLFLGGGIGMTFGDITRIDIAPVAGMWVVPQWSIGVGGRYTFYKPRYIGSSSSVSGTHIWGVSGFTQVLPFPDIGTLLNKEIGGGPILHGEYEGLYYDTKLMDPLAPSTGKQWVDILFVGGGWRQQVGDRAAINILLLWNLSGQDFTPYTSNPILRFTITF